MKNDARINIIPILLMALLLTACGSAPSMDTANDAGFVAVCDLSEDILGWKATTRGEITFLDLSPPDGVFLEIVDDGCQIGVFFHNDFWNTFSDEQQGYVVYGNMIEISGIIAKSGGDLHVTCQTIDLVE
jgi:hypothetical protein